MSRRHRERIAMFVATELVIGETAQRRKHEIAVAAPHEPNLVSMLGARGRNYHTAKRLRGVGNCAYNRVGIGGWP